jgi:hypothetical protein
MALIFVTKVFVTKVFVAKGEDKRALPVDTDNKLSGLRSLLEGDGFMTAQDVFAINGAQIALPDESDIAVKEVARDNTLVIRPGRAAAGSKNITLARGERKNVVPVDPRQKLSELRVRLQADKMITAQDRFEFSGAAIAQKDEAAITVEEVLKDIVLTVKSGSSGIRPGETPDRPKLDGLIPKADDYQLNPTAPEEAKKNLDKILEERGAAKTEGLAYYCNLSDAEKKQLLFSKLQLTRGLIIQPKGVNKSARAVRHLSGEPVYTMPEFTLDINRAISFSETVHELRKRGVQTAKGSAGATGVAVSGSYTHEKETFTQDREEKVYLLATEDVPKVELQFLPEQIRPTDEFLNAIGNVIDRSPGGAATEQQYFALLDVLGQFGYYVPTKFTVGGQIWAEDRKQVKSQVEAEREMTSFGVSFEANLANEVSTVTTARMGTLADRLRELSRLLPEDWLKAAAVRAALGRACGELGLFANAIRHYRAALDAGHGDVPLQAIGQMANLQGCYAVESWKTARKVNGASLGAAADPSVYPQPVDEAIALLGKVCGLGETPERLASLGSA